MLFAYEKNSQNLINAQEAERNRSYICPSCMQKVILRRGKIKVSHFAHVKNSCHAFSEGESQEHLNGKIFLQHELAKWTGKAELEAYLPRLKQRPDVLWTSNQKKIAFEYQCAPLSIEKMVERSWGYRSHNYHYCWILGSRHLIKNSLRQQVAQFMRWSPNLGCYLIYLDSARSCFKVKYNIQAADFLPLKCYNYETNSLAELKAFLHQKHDLFYFPLQKGEQACQLRRFKERCHFPSKHIRHLQNICYEHGRILEELGSDLLLPTYRQPVFRGWHLAWKICQMFGLKKEGQEEFYCLPFINLNSKIK